MDPPVSDPDQNQNTPSFHCDLYDTELVHKISQTFLPGLATACVDNTTGDIFRSPGSVAADIRKEMIDYLTHRSETFVAEHTLLQGSAETEPSHDPFDIISDFIDDFATSKRNLFGRVSGWLLSERREDNIDDFAQEMEISGFWLNDHIQGLAQTLLKNVDFRNSSHCEMRFGTERELVEHGLDCGYREMNCGNEGCNAVFCAKQRESHDSVCPFKMVKCEQSCGESIMRREMDRHCITVCPMKLVNCAFRAVGCLVDVRQCEIQQHGLDNLREHLVCVLKSIYKEASEDDLRPRAEEIQQLSTRLSEARNARALTNLVKEVDAKLGPLKIKPKSISTVLESDKPESTEKKALEEAEIKGKEEVVSREADRELKVSEAEVAENVNEEGELKAQKLLEIGEFIKEGDNNSAADLSERTETKAPEVVVMDEDKEEETKQSITNETRGLETEVNDVNDEENRETKESAETKSVAPSRIVMDKEENEEGAETINSSARASAEAYDGEEYENVETKQTITNETRGLETEVNEVNRETEKSDETKSEAPTTIVMDKKENEEGAETIKSRPHASASDEAEALSKSSEGFSKSQAETEPNLS